MRTQFVVCSKRSTAAYICPWAAVIIKVEGGYRCFESYPDYFTWKEQQ
jgi:hypothetical protein